MADCQNWLSPVIVSRFFLFSTVMLRQNSYVSVSLIYLIHVSKIVLNLPCCSVSNGNGGLSGIAD